MQRPKSPKAASFKLPQNDKELNQAVGYLNAGDFQAAEPLYRRGLKRFPGNPYLLHDLGQCLLKLNRLEEAEQALRRAIRRNPDFPASYLVLADTLLAKNEVEAAIQLLQQTTERFPNHEAVVRGSSNVLFALCRHADAIPLLEAFLITNPDAVWAWNSLADANTGSMRPQQALAALERSIQADPYQVGTLKSAARTALQLRLFARSQELHELCLNADPSCAYWFHFGMGDLREKQQRYVDAVEHFRSALSLEPDNFDASNRVYILSHLLGEFDVAQARLEVDLQLIESNNRNARSFTLFAGSTADFLTDERIIAAHRAFDAAHAIPPDNRFHKRARCKPQRLRIGFLSGDFKNHPVAKFALPLFKALGQLDIELFAYSNVAMEDAATAKFKEVIPAWRNIRHLPDAHAARQIADDALDILVDLSGHTSDNRLPVLQWHPAPVQSTYLGYTATTGLSSIDFWILDDIVFPRNSTESTSERIYRLPRPWVAYPLNESVQMPHRVTKDPNLPFIFGSANAQKKMSPSTYQLFADVLRAVPGSVLLLKNPEVGSPEIASVVKNQFQSLGINPERIILFGFSADFNEHTAVIQQIDIALDTTPFSGGTTTCETLWMGVPVLTLTGPRFVNRMSSSMLAYLGLQEWTCATPEEFVAKAMLYALDDEGLCDFRQNIRQRMRASPLCDPVDLAKHLLAAFHHMLELAQ